jgi:hypothetical protein
MLNQNTQPFSNWVCGRRHYRFLHTAGKSINKPKLFDAYKKSIRFVSVKVTID